MKKFARQGVTWIRETVDLRDCFWISGLAAAAYGISLVCVPAAWITVGVALFWLGVKG